MVSQGYYPFLSLNKKAKLCKRSCVPETQRSQKKQGKPDVRARKSLDTTSATSWERKQKNAGDGPSVQLNRKVNELQGMLKASDIDNGR